MPDVCCTPMLFYILHILVLQTCALQVSVIQNLIDDNRPEVDVVQAALNEIDRRENVQSRVQRVLSTQRSDGTRIRAVFTREKLGCNGTQLDGCRQDPLLQHCELDVFNDSQSLTVLRSVCRPQNDSSISTQDHSDTLHSVPVTEHIRRLAKLAIGLMDTNTRGRHSLKEVISARATESFAGKFELIVVVSQHDCRSTCNITHLQCNLTVEYNPWSRISETLSVKYRNCTSFNARTQYQERRELILEVVDRISFNNKTVTGTTLSEISAEALRQLDVQEQALHRSKIIDITSVLKSNVSTGFVYSLKLLRRDTLCRQSGETLSAPVSQCQVNRDSPLQDCHLEILVEPSRLNIQLVRSECENVEELNRTVRQQQSSGQGQAWVDAPINSQTVDIVRQVVRLLDSTTDALKHHALQNVLMVQVIRREQGAAYRMSFLRRETLCPRDRIPVEIVPNCFFVSTVGAQQCSVTLVTNSADSARNLVLTLQTWYCAPAILTRFPQATQRDSPNVSASVLATARAAVAQIDVAKGESLHHRLVRILTAKSDANTGQLYCITLVREATTCRRDKVPAATVNSCSVEQTLPREFCDVQLQKTQEAAVKVAASYCNTLQNHWSFNSENVLGDPNKDSVIPTDAPTSGMVTNIQAGSTPGLPVTNNPAVSLPNTDVPSQTTQNFAQTTPQNSAVTQNPVTQNPGSQTTQDPGFQTTLNSEFQTTQNPGFQTTQNPGFQTTLNSEFQTTQNPGFQTTLNSEFQTTQNPGFQTTQNPGFQTTQNPGFQTTQNSGFQATQNPGIPTANLGFQTTQNAGFQTAQNSGFQTTQNPGIPTANLGFQTTQNPGFQTTQSSGFQTTQNSGFQTTQNSGFQTTQNSGFQTTQNSGFQTTQNPEFQTTQNPGFQTTQNQGVQTTKLPTTADADSGTTVATTETVTTHFVEAVVFSGDGDSTTATESAATTKSGDGVRHYPIDDDVTDYPQYENTDVTPDPMGSSYESTTFPEYGSTDYGVYGSTDYGVYGSTDYGVYGSTDYGVYGSTDYPLYGSTTENPFPTDYPVFGSTDYPIYGDSGSTDYSLYGLITATTPAPVASGTTHSQINTDTAFINKPVGWDHDVIGHVTSPPNLGSNIEEMDEFVLDIAYDTVAEMNHVRSNLTLVRRLAKLANVTSSQATVGTRYDLQFFWVDTTCLRGSVEDEQIILCPFDLQGTVERCEATVYHMQNGSRDLSTHNCVTATVDDISLSSYEYAVWTKIDIEDPWVDRTARTAVRQFYWQLYKSTRQPVLTTLLDAHIKTDGASRGLKFSAVVADSECIQGVKTNSECLIDRSKPNRRHCLIEFWDVPDGLPVYGQNCTEIR